MVTEEQIRKELFEPTLEQTEWDINNCYFVDIMFFVNEIVLVMMGG